MKAERSGAVLAVLLLCLVLGACAGRALNWEPESYVVREGDTLYSIAFRFGMDVRQLARLNDIGPPYLIHPGERLRLTGTASAGSGTVAANRERERDRSGGAATTRDVGGGTTDGRAGAARTAAASDISWRWPTDGDVVRSFGEGRQTGKGIDIRGQEGQPVRAAGSGRVVYSGSGLIGYGRLIIIKHDDTFISAYAHNRRIAVAEGDAVTVGDVIGEMGRGPDDAPLLHFEIRVDGEAVDPLLYLPER